MSLFGERKKKIPAAESCRGSSLGILVMPVKTYLAALRFFRKRKVRAAAEIAMTVTAIMM